MEKRNLGNTGLEVTLLGHGTTEIRGSRSWNGRSVSDDEAERILHAVLDAGINLLDTAPDYGLSEAYIGRYISHRRDEYYLASKCGCTIVANEDHDDYPHVWTRATLMHNIETSLQRMKTDYIDLWQPHNPPPGPFQAEALVEVMQRVVQQGKVRHIGISTTLPDIETFIDWGVFESFQIPYSALERREEHSISAAAAAGAGTIIRGGVAQGEPGAGRGKTETWTAWEKAQLDELRGAGESPTAFLLRFTISHPDMDTTIVATKNPAHLAENLQAVAAGPLPRELYAEAKRRLDRVGQKPAS